ncbi:MAG: PAS and helix-turn-helix domain-containing protein [Paracoccaceae bacterium]
MPHLNYGANTVETRGAQQLQSETFQTLANIAYDSAPVGIVLTEKRIIKSCNQTFADMLGFAKNQLLDQSFRMLYSSRKEFEDIRDVGLKPLKELGVYSDERIMRRKDCSLIWCRFRAQTLTRDTPLDRTVLSFALVSDTVPNIKLTPRQRQVILLLSRGLTSKSIGRELEISPRTVEDVRARLLKNFKSKNTTELLTRLSGIDH